LSFGRGSHFADCSGSRAAWPSAARREPRGKACGGLPRWLRRFFSAGSSSAPVRAKSGATRKRGS
jgi:hypothetical protein